MDERREEVGNADEGEEQPVAWIKEESTVGVDDAHMGKREVRPPSQEAAWLGSAMELALETPCRPPWQEMLCL